MKNVEPKRQSKKEAYAQDKGKMTKHCNLHNKVQNLLLQIWKGPDYICTVSHQSLNKCSVKLFHQEKYQVLQVTEFLDPNKVTPCQTVVHKIYIELLPSELRS